MTYIKRFRLASSTCRFTSFMKSVESLALFILWCLCTIPCIEKQARGAHISKSDFFLTSMMAPPGDVLRRNKNVPWTSFFVSTWSNLISSNKIGFHFVPIDSTERRKNAMRTGSAWRVVFSCTGCSRDSKRWSSTQTLSMVSISLSFSHSTHGSCRKVIDFET